MATSRGGLPLARPHLMSHIPVLLLFWLGWASSAWPADDYLSELAAEAEKLEQSVGDTAPDGEPDGAIPGAPDGSMNAARDAFEHQLKKRYLGTYGFYKKLPERSRQEVFEEYRQGADMNDLRKKIINRLLHR